MVSMFSILSQRRLHWLGHVCRMDDGRIQKDILYGQLATGTRPTGRPALRYKDVCKRDLKSCSMNPTDLKTTTSDRSSWWVNVKTGVKQTKEQREIQREEKKRCKQQRPQSVTAPPTVTTGDTLIASMVGTAAFALAYSVTASAAAPLLAIFNLNQVQLHCLLRQKDATC